jgi:hypothetical protein
MALSNAERQARWRAKRAAEIAALRAAAADVALKAENAALKAEIEKLKARCSMKL